MPLNTPIKILALQSVLGRSRHAKRVRMLQTAGCVVEVAAFHRKEETLSRVPDCKITKLGSLTHGNYLARIFKFPKVIPRLRQLIKSNDVVYTFGPDMACLAMIAGIGLGKPVCMDIADVRKIQVSPRLKGKLVRFIDKRVAKKCSLVVASAKGFIDGYYGERLGVRCESLVIENKLEAGALEGSLDDEADTFDPERKISVGYFGILRCPWSASLLQKLATEYPNRFSVVLAGESQLDIDLEQLDRTIPNFHYLGPYKSPQDLPRLYGQIDLMWACYPPPRENCSPEWWWAQAICRSNRFYECCFYKKPLIAMAQSGDGIEVKEMGIGHVFDTYDQDEVMANLAKSIDRKQISNWKARMEELSSETYQYTNEGETLVSAIQAVLH